jgi:hypothetical protein
MDDSLANDSRGDPLSTRINALNVEMLRQAGAGDWDRVAEALKIRAALLSDVAAADRQAALAASCRATRKVLALAQAEKRSVAEQLSSLNHGRRATDCYRDAGNHGI